MMTHEEHQEPASKSISSGIACPETEFLPQNSVSSLGNPVGCTLRSNDWIRRSSKRIARAIANPAIELP